MSRSREDSRIGQLVDAGARVFIRRGYRRSSMADVAREMGVAPGTLYLYVESKEALFHLLVLRTLVNPSAEPPGLPIPTPPPGRTIEELRTVLAIDSYAPRLAAASSAAPDGKSEISPFPELETVVCELYDSAYDHRIGINLIEGSAIDWPEMAELFYRGLRMQLVDAIGRYLANGIAKGVVRTVPDVRVAARFVLEAIAWFAIHRHGDPGGVDFDDRTARAVTVDMITTALRRQETEWTQ